MCTLSQLSRRTSRSVRLINGDTPGLAMYCGKKQSHKSSSLRSSSASSSVRSCSDRATNFDKHSRFAQTSASRLNDSCFPGLDSHIAFHPLLRFDLFQLGGIHCNCSKCGRPRYLHLYLLSSEQHWRGQSAHTSSRNRGFRHTTDFPEL